MRTELDQRMDATMAALTAPGGMLALTQVERPWGSLPAIAAAPPSLPLYFTHYCAEHADKTLIVAGAERLSFAETYALAQRVARALVAGYGIGKGDRVGIAMRNSPSWIVLYMGIVMAGGVATLLNGWWQAEELGEAIVAVDCALVVADGPRAERIAAAPGVKPAMVTIEDRLPLAQALEPVIARDVADTALPAVGAEDDATILFTSGSTGKSKGAVSQHRAVVQGTFSFLSQALMMLAIATADGNAPTIQPATLLTLPLFHVTAEVTVMLQSFAMGRKLVLMPKWDALEAMRLIEAEQVTYFVGVPLMSFEILTHPERHRFDLSTVTDFAAGGAPRPVEHVRRLNEELGGPAPLIGYGLTETNAVGAGNWRSNYLNKPASTGRPSAPLVEIAILDEAGARLPQGERGEIAIRSICNFRGYWNNPEATAACITADGFFRTGDLGYLDEDGYVFIVDRAKDIVIRGGENIACQEVEAALYAHPAVAEAAVFGLADERYGEVPGAVVHLREGEGAGGGVDEAALRAFLGEHIAAFKVPTRIWLSAVALPRLGTEKIDKVSLRNMYRALAAA
ncbi:class I adenylate-forming enzyme family protein [Sphingomonas sp. XXL09]|uniref:class I adenylate-forming enzyme family protein n=1 Tax=Sphingomonas sp. XXL09 TaxID=3457787 RepID=UPI00406BC7CD